MDPGSASGDEDGSDHRADIDAALHAALEQRRRGQHDAARSALVVLAARAPAHAAVQYQAACVHDALGLEAQAVPYYERALALDPTPVDARGAYLGLGSTLRVLGRYAEAEAVLRAGLVRFAGAAELRTFLAMTLYNRGRAHEAMRLALGAIADTSADADVQALARAIRFYAEDLDRRWDA